MDVVSTEDVNIGKSVVHPANTKSQDVDVSSIEEMVTNGDPSSKDVEVVSSDSSKLGSWHAHEYSNNHATPTPFTISDILGWGKPTAIVVTEQVKSEMEAPAGKSSTFGDVPILSIPLPRSSLLLDSLKSDEPLNLTVTPQRTQPTIKEAQTKCNNNNNTTNNNNNNNNGSSTTKRTHSQLDTLEKKSSPKNIDVLLPNDVIIPSFKSSQPKLGGTKNGKLRGET